MTEHGQSRSGTWHGRNVPNPFPQIGLNGNVSWIPSATDLDNFAYLLHNGFRTILFGRLNMILSRIVFSFAKDRAGVDIQNAEAPLHGLDVYNTTTQSRQSRPFSSRSPVQCYPLLFPA